jgi:hypothetical protein
MIPEIEAAESQAISNNALYKTYTNEVKIEKLKYDITLQYPVDWFLEEINKIGAWTSTAELVFISNPAENVFIWINLVPWFSETDAETNYGTPGVVKIGLKNWCSSKTFQSDGFICRDLNQDVKTITKYGKKQYHVLASYTLDYGDGDIDEKKNLTAVITNINSSWEVSVLTSSNHWDRYKHDIYSIIDSIQTISNNVKSNENGLLRLSSNVYELPKAGATNMYQNAVNVDVFGEFSEGKVGSVIMKVIKPDGKIDQENIKMGRYGTSFNHQYKIKSDFPIGEYQITVSTNINDIQLGSISFTVIAADPENQICGGVGYGSGYGYYSERLGTPPPGVCFMINNPVLEKQVEDKKIPEPTPTPMPTKSVTAIPEWIKNNAGWWADGQIDDSSFLQGIQFLIKEGIMVIPPTETSGSSDSQGVPAWVKNNAGWWADGQIDDNSFVSGIQYLVKVGIIKVS